jgi:hypothetical protein
MPSGDPRGSSPLLMAVLAAIVVPSVSKINLRVMRSQRVETCSVFWSTLSCRNHRDTECEPMANTQNHSMQCHKDEFCLFIVRAHEEHSKASGNKKHVLVTRYHQHGKLCSLTRVCACVRVCMYVCCKNIALAYPPSTSSSMANKTRSKFSRQLFFSTAPRSNNPIASHIAVST